MWTDDSLAEFNGMSPNDVSTHFATKKVQTENTMNLMHKMHRPRVDRVPVSVSEWLLGSFVLILFGDYVYFSWFNSHISKE